MRILHIASIDNNPFNGVCVAVPYHVIHQGNYAEVMFVNIENKKIEGLKRVQKEFTKPFDINKVSSPFNKPDLVVFHECFRIEYIEIYKNLKKNNIPYIIIPHGELRNESLKKKWLKKKVAGILLFNSFINNALAIQVLSKAEYDGTTIAKNKIIGTNGVEMPTNYKTDFNEDGLLFLYIGRYEWRVKGLDILLDAIKSVEDILVENNCRFELYGPDRQNRLADLKAMVKERNIGHIVALNEPITGTVKIKKLLEADIFVQTSRHEGMPMGILESLSYGLPCLITEGTVMGDFVNQYDAGWVAKTNANDVAEKIKLAIKERDKFKEKSSNGRKLTAELFSWDVISKKTVEDYKELLGEKR